MALQADQLLRLQELDLRLDTLMRERAALDAGTALKEAFERAEAALSEAKTRLHSLQVEQTSAELEEKTVEEKKAAVSKKLYAGKVTNPKELAAMEQEIEMFGRQRGRLDERILLLMDEIEATTAEIERLTAERDTARADWERQSARYKRELARITTELRQLAPERNALAAAIDPKTLQRYEDLRRRAANLAAVRVVDGICGGCRVSLPTVLLRQVSEAQRYTFCENCGRFLLPEPG